MLLLNAGSSKTNLTQTDEMDVEGPEFPVEVGGVGELLAAFLKESRIRSSCRVLTSRKFGRASQ
jgi:hypothetical protein